MVISLNPVAPLSERDLCSFESSINCSAPVSLQARQANRDLRTRSLSTVEGLVTLPHTLTMMDEIGLRRKRGSTAIRCVVPRRICSIGGHAGHRIEQREQHQAREKS